jgi:Arm DNA-binding domain
MSIKELQARSAVPRAKPYKLATGEGLFLLVQPSGSKLWRMKYRFGGKEKLLSFGTYAAISLAAARSTSAVAPSSVSVRFSSSQLLGAGQRLISQRIGNQIKKASASRDFGQSCGRAREVGRICAPCFSGVLARRATPRTASYE